jgi:hypothetical protein
MTFSLLIHYPWSAALDRIVAPRADECRRTAGDRANFGKKIEEIHANAVCKVNNENNKNGSLSQTVRAPFRSLLSLRRQ